MAKWIHYTSNPIQTTATALARAGDGTMWLVMPSERARLMRVLLVVSLQSATISDAPSPLGLLDGKNYGGDDIRNAAGAAVARTAAVITTASPNVMIPPNHDVVSTDDFGPSPLPPTDPSPIDVSALPAVAVVLLGSAAAAAACYVATVISEHVHAIAFEEEKTKRLLHRHTASVNAIAEHVKREKIAGKILPFDEEEKKVLKSLEDVQREIVKERHQPLPSPFDGAREFGMAIADTTRKVGDATAGTVSWALPVAIGIGALALAQNLGRSDS